MGVARRRGGWLGGIAIVTLALALAAGADGASRTIYIADTPDYAVAFKTEAGERYALGLDGTSHCFFTEPHEDFGPSWFSLFRAPVPMRKTPTGFSVYGSLSGPFASAEGGIHANFGGDAVTGSFGYSENEEGGLRCKGSSGKGFEAVPYEPVAGGDTVQPKAGEQRAYYEDEGGIEVFLRRDARHYFIRGDFVPSCPVGRTGAVPEVASFFDSTVRVRRGDDAGFRHADVRSGSTRGGGGFKETSTFVGRFGKAAIVGSFTRVRTTTPAHGPARRCVTGPLRFSAPRYLPAKPPKGDR